LAHNHTSEEVAFTLVYIREAHANDEWPSPSSRDQPQGKVIDVPSHNTISERIGLAKMMKEEMEIDSKVEVLVDNMEDEFNKEFAAWPIRYFIAKDGRLLHKSDNSIENDLFDQDSIQNFFRGLGFVRVHVPKPPNFGPKSRTKMANFSSGTIPRPWSPPPEPKTKMAHLSSGRFPPPPAQTRTRVAQFSSGAVNTNHPSEIPTPPPPPPLPTPPPPPPHLSHKELLTKAAQRIFKQPQTLSYEGRQMAGIRHRIFRPNQV